MDFTQKGNGPTSYDRGYKSVVITASTMTSSRKALQHTGFVEKGSYNKQRIRQQGIRRSRLPLLNLSNFVFKTFCMLYIVLSFFYASLFCGTSHYAQNETVFKNQTPNSICSTFRKTSQCQICLIKDYHHHYHHHQRNSYQACL